MMDKSRLFATNVHTILQNQPISSIVEEWDVVWFMDGVWVPVDGTVKQTIEQFNWGLAYHVDQEKGTSKVWYYGEVSGCCDPINYTGYWYADKDGKLTQVETEFYVGYSQAPKSICLELYSMDFKCNPLIVYPVEPVVNYWANTLSTHDLKLSFLSEPTTTNYIKWGKVNPADTLGYLADVATPTRFEINETDYETKYNRKFEFNLSSDINIPETSTLHLGGYLKIGVDFVINVLSKTAGSIVETIDEGNIFIIEPELDLTPDQVYFEIEFLKPFNELVKGEGVSLDIYAGDENTFRCNLSDSVFYFWFTNV